jgi:predicted Zn-dependent protease with MMP-like domain
MSADDTPAYGLDDDRWAGEEESGPEDEILDRAWEALDDGQAEQALSVLAELDADWPERWIPEALARTELGQLAAARKLISRAGEFEGFADHPDFLWASGLLLLREWRVGEARAALERLATIEPSAGTFERLSLCAELVGDFATADRWLVDASELDPSLPAPPRLTTDEFEAVVHEAIEQLSEEFRRPLEAAEVIVEPVPSEWMIDRADPGETPPDLLGLFVGASELERSEYETGALPPRIFLFQRNIERAARDRGELVEQIRVTLFHEVGHMLGFDEEGVTALGLE